MRGGVRPAWNKPRDTCSRCGKPLFGEGKSIMGGKNFHTSPCAGNYLADFYREVSLRLFYADALCFEYYARIREKGGVRTGVNNPKP